MKIELATRNDVPELLKLQFKAFAPVAQKLQFAGIPQQMPPPLTTPTRTSTATQR